jgi:hypothetical protein
MTIRDYSSSPAQFPPLRSVFLQAVAAALATSNAVGPGAVHRVGAELQKRFTLELPALAEREP